jgi:drug/metabolite transporter (DMT)-like permease
MVKQVLRKTPLLRVAVLTVLSLLAFASNSVLCRLALGDATIDAAGFTAIRLFAGAIVLALLVRGRSQRDANADRVADVGSYFASVALFVYAAAFSFAYRSLETGSGALILFGAVQLSMISAALCSGHRPHVLEWCGLAAALGGFVYLVLPGVSAPPLGGFLLMASAGIAWALYTLRGLSSSDPLAANAQNFLRTLPLVALLLIVFIADLQLSTRGIVLAALSGAVASGVGYSVWYLALGGLTALQAGVVQLSVPLIAALGGVLFVGETVTLRLALAAAAILGGIFLVLLARRASA